MHSLRAVLVVLLFIASHMARADEAAPRPPNVVILYADDLGYGDVRCYNPDRGRIPTPRIDGLAAEGMRFTDAHSSSGVCSPSRYTLLTGRYHWRTRLQAGIVNPWGPPLIAPDRVTVAGLAARHGYRTACIGKWHLGWDWPIPGDRAAVFKEQPKGAAAATDAHRAVWREVFSLPIGGGPTTRGFDRYFGTDVPNWPPFCFIENDRTVGIPAEFLPARLLGDNQASVPGPALADWSLEPILPALGDRAAAFIADAAGRPEPFLLYMPLTSPHTPLAVNEAWQGRSGLNRYADFVMETDAVIGRVLDALDQRGAAADTLVVFTSDNGCAPYVGKAELEAKGHFPSGPLRGAKADAWEGGHRVPFIVRWPAVVEPGSVCDQLVHQADLLRTVADVLGVTLPDDAGEDSVSLLPLLRGGGAPVREHAVSASVTGVPAVRSGSWKYIAAPGSGGWGQGGDQSQPVQLYDLAADLGETTNLAAKMPEKVAEMQALLEALITAGRSTPGQPRKNDVEVIRHRPAAAILLDSPRDREVIQRSPREDAVVRIAGRLPGAPADSATVVEARVVRAGRKTPWRSIDAAVNGRDFTGTLVAPAGGWWTLEVRAPLGDGTFATGGVPHVGIGEVFVVAGQSNSANHGEERQRPKTGRVATFDGRAWRLADDPQPGASGGGGSFLPAFGDAVVESQDVPVGIVACGIGATSVREWLPKGATFPNPPTLTGRVVQRPDGTWASDGAAFEAFVARMKPFGPNGFRAVLWHQGESDANQQDPARTLPGPLYRDSLETLIRESRRAIGWDAPWFVAQASYHVPGDEGSDDIRAAQAALWQDAVALEGPDSDALKGPLRERGGQGVHFSAAGLREHGARWADKVIPWLERRRTEPRP